MNELQAIADQALSYRARAEELRSQIARLTERAAECERLSKMAMRHVTASRMEGLQSGNTDLPVPEWTPRKPLSGLADLPIYPTPEAWPMPNAPEVLP